MLMSISIPRMTIENQVCKIFIENFYNISNHQTYN